MSRRWHGPRGRPPWWPENEDWPPRRRPQGRGPRLVGVLVLLWLLVNVTIAVAVGTAVAHGVGGFALAVLALLVLAVILLGGGRRGRVMRWRLRQLTEAASRLQALDERRRTFLAELAHELRTPLAVIRAQGEAIADGVYPGDAEHVAPILDAAHTMESLVADLRTLAESEAGALTLDREPVALAELVPEVLAAQHAQAAGVQLIADLTPDLPPVDADPLRIRRVLVNLLQNSIAHTPAGGVVRVTAAREGGHVSVSVSDTGSGLEPDLAERAFERFARGPGSRGSGLGLSIARDIVEAHGGGISLESEPGRGTRVSFRLPVARSG